MTQQRIFFNASLPRAGSTLLSNIIGHHPQFHASPTSALIDLILGARIGYNDAPQIAYTNTNDLRSDKIKMASIDPVSAT